MPSPAPSFPLADADLCVKCGLCLPHCPTYLLTQDEGDSPRGRIALMQGLATGLVQQNPRLERHLDQCLACRACEAVCPANVPYGRLIDAGRQSLAWNRPSRSLGLRLMGALLTLRRLRRSFAAALRLYQGTGLQALFRRFRLLGHGRLARLESLLPEQLSAPHWQPVYPAKGTTSGTMRGRVALFLGCVSEVAETGTLCDAIMVLTALGYEVHVPAKQGCCGALHQHNGMPAEATRLAAANLSAFSGDYAAVLGTASGCTATLKEYDQMMGTAAAGSLVARVEDLGAFLARCEWPEDLRLEPLAAHVTVQDPCTLSNVLKSQKGAYALLARIPQLKVEALRGNTRCCGAAGSYFLTEPDMADRLVAMKLESLSAQLPDYLVTSNIGCALHLSGALRRAGIGMPVLHPVSLIARQLPAELKSRSTPVRRPGAA